MKTSKIKCFYHSADLDGHCSGAIVKFTFPEAELFPINYGDNFPWHYIDVTDIVYLVDFSLQPVNNMNKLYNILKNNLIWVDHHISAINDFKTHYPNININGIQQNGVAACELIWKYLFPKNQIPTSVKLLSKYDVWKLDENVLPFQYGLRLENTWPENQNLWENLFIDNEQINSIINSGKTIINYQTKQDEKYCKSNAFEVEFEGYKAVVINKTLTSSLTLKSVWDNSKYDIMINFGVDKSGFWKFSFYTDKNGIDVSILAKKFGGGGHKQASGCQFKTLPLPFIEKFKELQKGIMESIY